MACWRAIARGVGNPIILVGADTGRDGIGGANVLASRTFEAGQEELRPTVQVGNPFLEKLLMEACVELAEQHADWIVGLQDCGAAGPDELAGRVRGARATPASRSTWRWCRGASPA